MAAQSRRKRRLGFVLFLCSNILWITWGSQASAYGLVSLHCCLGVLNARGLFKNDPDAAPKKNAAKEERPPAKSTTERTATS